MEGKIKMEKEEDILILDCPRCQGPAIVEDEGDWCCYITCLDCGCHTVEVAYKSKEERLSGLKKAATLWNCGKVIHTERGE